MKYLESNLGQLDAGRTVQFTLRGNAANVRLVDSANLGRFKRGERFQYVGGHATASPVNLRTPSVGHWHAVVDLGGLAGSVDASVRLIGGRS